MALTAYTLTVETVDLHGADLSGVEVSIVVSNVALYTGGTPTEHVIPSTLVGVTNAAGVATFQLLPSSIVGTYDVNVGGFVRTITMPAANARLSGLGDSVAPDEAIGLLDVRLARVAADLSGDEQSAIATKLGLAAGMDRYVSAATLGNDNMLTFTLMNGTDFSVDLSSLSDTLTDTNTYVTAAALATNGTLTLTLSDASTVTVDLSELQTDEAQVTIIKVEISGGLNGVFDAVSVGDTIYVTKSGTTTVSAEVIFKSRSGSRATLHIENSDLSNFLSGNVLIRSGSDTGTTIALASDYKTAEANLTNSGDYIITEDVETGGLDLWRLLHEIEADLQAQIDLKANNSTLALTGSNMLTLTDSLGNAVSVDLSSLVVTDTDTDTTNSTLAIDSSTNVLTLTDSAGNTVMADLSQLVDTLTDTNFYVSAASLGENGVLTLTVTGGTDVTVDLSGLGGMATNIVGGRFQAITGTRASTAVAVGSTADITVTAVSGTSLCTQGTSTDADKIVIASPGTYRLYGSLNVSGNNRTAPGLSVDGTDVTVLGYVNAYVRDGDTALDVKRWVDFDVASADTTVTLQVANREIYDSSDTGIELKSVTVASVSDLRLVAISGIKGGKGEKGDAGTTVASLELGNDNVLTLTDGSSNTVTVDLSALVTTDTDTTNATLALGAGDNVLTLTDSAGNTVTADLSQLVDTFTDTNTYVSAATLGTDNTLTLTVTGGTDVTVDLSDLVGTTVDLSDYQVHVFTIALTSAAHRTNFDLIGGYGTPLQLQKSGEDNLNTVVLTRYRTSTIGTIVIAASADISDHKSGTVVFYAGDPLAVLFGYNSLQSDIDDVDTVGEWHIAEDVAASGAETWKEISRVLGLVPTDRYVSAAALSGTSLTLTVANGVNVTVDLASINTDTDTDTNTTNSSFTFDSDTNVLTLTDSAGGSIEIDLSALSDSFTDTNTTVSTASLGTDSVLTLTMSDSSTVTVDLSGLGGGSAMNIVGGRFQAITGTRASTSVAAGATADITVTAVTGTDLCTQGTSTDADKIVIASPGTYRLYGKINASGSERTAPGFSVDGTDVTILGYMNEYLRDADTAFDVDRWVDFDVETADTVVTLQVSNRSIVTSSGSFGIVAVTIASVSDLRLVAISGIKGGKGDKGVEGGSTNASLSLGNDNVLTLTDSDSNAVTVDLSPLVVTDTDTTNATLALDSSTNVLTLTDSAGNAVTADLSQLVDTFTDTDTNFYVSAATLGMDNTLTLTVTGGTDVTVDLSDLAGGGTADLSEYQVHIITFEVGSSSKADVFDGVTDAATIRVAGTQIEMTVVNSFRSDFTCTLEVLAENIDLSAVITGAGYSVASGHQGSLEAIQDLTTLVSDAASVDTFGEFHIESNVPAAGEYILNRLNESVSADSFTPYEAFRISFWVESSEFDFFDDDLRPFLIVLTSTDVSGPLDAVVISNSRHNNVAEIVALPLGNGNVAPYKSGDVVISYRGSGVIGFDTHVDHADDVDADDQYHIEEDIAAAGRVVVDALADLNTDKLGQAEYDDDQAGRTVDHWAFYLGTASQQAIFDSVDDTLVIAKMSETDLVLSVLHKWRVGSVGHIFVVPNDRRSRFTFGTVNFYTATTKATAELIGEFDTFVTSLSNLDAADEYFLDAEAPAAGKSVFDRINDTRGIIDTQRMTVVAIYADGSIGQPNYRRRFRQFQNDFFPGPIKWKKQGETTVETRVFHGGSEVGHGSGYLGFLYIEPADLDAFKTGSITIDWENVHGDDITFFELTGPAKTSISDIDSSNDYAIFEDVYVASTDQWRVIETINDAINSIFSANSVSFDESARRLTITTSNKYSEASDLEVDLSPLAETTGLEPYQVHIITLSSLDSDGSSQGLFFDWLFTLGNGDTVTFRRSGDDDVDVYVLFRPLINSATTTMYVSATADFSDIYSDGTVNVVDENGTTRTVLDTIESDVDDVRDNGYGHWNIQQNLPSAGQNLWDRLSIEREISDALYIGAIRVGLNGTVLDIDGWRSGAYRDQDTVDLAPLFGDYMSPRLTVYLNDAADRTLFDTIIAAGDLYLADDETTPNSDTFDVFKATRTATLGTILLHPGVDLSNFQTGTISVGPTSSNTIDFTTLAGTLADVDADAEYFWDEVPTAGDEVLAEITRALSSSDTNTYVTGATLSSANVLTITLSDASTVTVDLSSLAGGGGSADLSDYELQRFTVYLSNNTYREDFDDALAAEMFYLEDDELFPTGTQFPFYEASRTNTVGTVIFNPTADLSLFKSGTIRFGTSSTNKSSATTLVNSLAAVNSSGEYHWDTIPAAGQKIIEDKWNKPRLLAWDSIGIRTGTINTVQDVDGVPLVVPDNGSLAVTILDANNIFVGSSIIPCQQIRLGVVPTYRASITDERSLGSNARTKTGVNLGVTSVTRNSVVYNPSLVLSRRGSLSQGVYRALVYHVPDLFTRTGDPGRNADTDTVDKWSDDAQAIFDLVDGSAPSAVRRQTNGTWRKDYQTGDGFYTITGLDQNDEWVTTVYDSDDDSLIASKTAARPSDGVWNFNYASLLTP